jgi:CheY-like chemotaxis protein/anti-sigma regulatory factor (Ser/Thr protein kinase)
VLATVIGLASVIEAETDPDSAVYQDVQGILTASKRGMRLTRNLLGFSKNGTVVFKEPIRLQDLLGKAVSLLQRTSPKEVEIQVEMAKDLEDIEGDPSQIRHMLINLAANAIDAMHGQGTLAITTRNVEIGKGEIGSLDPGRYVRLQVSDTGRGMDQETMQQAFEPFFTTKPRGTASGLGLPLVHRIVRSHGGQIDLYSKKGLGTTVTIHLPTRYVAREAKETGARLSRLPQRSGTILLVDDEKLVRMSARRILRMMGFAVITAANGKEAIERFQEHRDEIVAVLLDLIMPEMDGAVALQELKKIDPEVRVVISSGYTREEPVNQILERGAAAFVQKPYTVQQLADALDEVLGG